MITGLALLFLAGVAGGIVNAVAGGGSFITFPALLWAGVPPIAANATNTFASTSGYLSGAYAFRHDLAGIRSELPRILGLSLIGGAAGALLLIKTPSQAFIAAIPWLLLFATLLFIFGARLTRLIGTHRPGGEATSLTGRLPFAAMLLMVSVYGGFFNAGLGIITLSYLALAGLDDINRMNGLKLVVSSAVSVMAIVLFVFEGLIAWREGLAVLAGTLAGGYLAAHLSRRLPQAHVRRIVAIAGIVITAYYFFDVYGRG